MTTHRQGRIARQRSGRSDTRRAPARAAAPQTGRALDRLLALSPLDQALGQLLGHPHALQIVGILVGIVTVGLALRPLIWPVASPSAPVSNTAMQRLREPALSAPAVPPAAGTHEEEVLDVVAAYNQASISAAVLGRVEVLAPYLAPDGKPWADVQAEYQRRATRRETHYPALTRWGVLRIAVDGDIATVETQEQWDDLTSVGGAVISSKRGILTRNTYALRRPSSLGRWLITDVTTTVVIG